MTDPHTLPIGTEIGNGLRVGYGGIVTACPVLAVPITRRPTVATAVASAKKSKFQELLESGSDSDLAKWLLDHQTLSDATWKSRQGRKSRAKGESRRDFIARVLGEGA